MGMTIDEWYSGKREKRPLVKGPLWCNASDASESSSDEHERARQEERQEDVGNKEDAARGEETSVEETSHRLDKTGRTDRVERRGATHSESGRAEGNGQMVEAAEFEGRYRVFFIVPVLSLLQ